MACAVDAAGGAASAEGHGLNMHPPGCDLV